MEGSEVHWQGRPHLGLVPMEHSWKEEFTHIAADGTRLRLFSNHFSRVVYCVVDVCANVPSVGPLGSSARPMPPPPPPGRSAVVVNGVAMNYTAKVAVTFPRSSDMRRVMCLCMRVCVFPRVPPYRAPACCAPAWPLNGRPRATARV